MTIRESFRRYYWFQAVLQMSLSTFDGHSGWDLIIGSFFNAILICLATSGVIAIGHIVARLRWPSISIRWSR